MNRRRSVVRAFLVNHPWAAARLLAGGLGLLLIGFSVRLALAERADVSGAIIAMAFGIVCLIIATGGD